MKPPPKPVDWGLTTPRQVRVAIQASTALPPSRRTSVPAFEQTGISEATEAVGKLVILLGEGGGQFQRQAVSNKRKAKLTFVGISGMEGFPMVD